MRHLRRRAAVSRVPTTTGLGRDAGSVTDSSERGGGVAARTDTREFPPPSRVSAGSRSAPVHGGAEREPEPENEGEPKKETERETEK